LEIIDFKARGTIVHNIVKQRLGALATLCVKHNAKRLELFGSASVAIEENDPIGDVDFLVEFLPLSPEEHCDRYFSLLEELESLFGEKIDLVEAKAMKNPYFIRRVNESRTLVYAAA